MARDCGDQTTVYRITRKAKKYDSVCYYGPYGTMSAAKSLVTREKKYYKGAYEYSIQASELTWVECDMED